MTKLTEPLYLPGANEPMGVLPWGKSPEQTKSDLAAVVARVGGNRPPNYGQTYLLAANTLLTTAQAGGVLDHHGLPIFFMQRHAAELMIKDALLLGIEVQKYRKKLHIPSPAFPNSNQINRAEGCHDLDVLFCDLADMAKALQAGPVPKALHAVIGEIRKVEQREPSWSRYSFHKEGPKEAKTRHAHLQEEITIPLGKIQNLLQTANDNLGTIWPFNGSLIGMLGSQLEPLLRQAGEIE
ncbi:MAG: hypothetical protein RR715_00055 [Comamonas sp.]